MLVYDRPQEVADWIASQVGVTAPSVDAAIGFEVDGQMKAGVYFDMLTDNNVFAHIASTAVTCPPDLLAAVARYVFGQLGLDRITFAVSSGNAKTLDLVRGMGSLQEATLRQACRPHDLLLFSLWKRDPFPQRLLTRGVVNVKP